MMQKLGFRLNPETKTSRNPKLIKKTLRNETAAKISGVKLIIRNFWPELQFQVEYLKIPLIVKYLGHFRSVSKKFVRTMGKCFSSKIDQIEPKKG